MVSVSEANKQLGKSPFSIFSFILVCFYILGELVALRAAKLSNKRKLRKLDTRKNQVQKEVEQKAQQNADKKKAGVAVDDVQVDTEGGSKAPPRGKSKLDNVDPILNNHVFSEYIPKDDISFKSNVLGQIKSCQDQRDGEKSHQKPNGRVDQKGQIIPRSI